ncbi:MAG TPA: peptidase S8, partial [Puia sp.]|nr:peptidase S8 [Puia sp.]
NNLDLTVTSPDATVHHPLILDPTPSNVNNNALEGVDNTNNIEQVVINNPPAGNFTITVKGTHIPLGPQDYVVAYEIINPSVNVEYPFGNETFVPGETENIRWSAYGGEPNSFTVEYSADNGSTWNLLSNSVPSASRLYQWTVPMAATTTGLIRVTRNTAGFSDTSHFPFTILGQPVITLTNPCPGYGQLIWNTVPSATQYEIMILKGDSMQTIASTTDTSYLIGGLNRDSSYWVSVRAISGTTAGRRAIAVNLNPTTGPCSLAAFNNDFTIDSLITPVTGRMFTSTQLGNTDLQVELKNLGSIPSAGPYNLSFQVNGGAVVTESSSASIPAGTATVYTFSPANKFDFSATGTYNVKVWVDYPGDPQLSNDTIMTIIKQLKNDPLTLNPVFTEGFESADPQTYLARTIGLSGLDRCDFNASDPNGRARTFVNTGFARTGLRCVTLDQSRNKPVSTADSLMTTFNLSGYTAADQIWLDFWYKNQGVDFSLPGNKVWIRGNDQAAWLAADSLSHLAADIGIYKASRTIDVTGILAGAVPSQTISSSFQVKFGEQGYTSANSVIPDGNLDDGYSFDDISITKSLNDLGMNALIQPVLTNICNLSSAEVISAQVKNYSNATFNNIPISYRINGTTITETIPSIGPNQTINYTFSQTADLSGYKNYTLDLWVSNPSDNYHKNDSLLNINFQTTPVISSYPYLEGFENNNGYWYTQGINDSWQWGTPAKTIINKAANGTKAWVTNLTGNYNDNELSYLYSPCFDLSSLIRPVLSFSHIFRTEDNCDCDYHWVEYSTDDVNWIKLGLKGNGTNWYDDSINESWQLSYTIWHVSSIDIPTRANKTRFRFVMSSDPATNYEGIGIDDVHIFDKAPIYNGSNISSGLSQNLNGSNWINFDMDSNRVLSVNPNGQDLGNTQVKVFVNKTGVRNSNSQYYLDRNIVIQPSSAPTGNVSIRFYFLDSEADSLIKAAGCGSCTGISDAYESGISQYSKAL